MSVRYGENVKVIIKVSDFSEIEKVMEKIREIKERGSYEHSEMIIEADLRKKLFRIF